MKSNLTKKNFIQSTYLNSRYFKKLSINFNKIVSEINQEILEFDTTLNILSENYNFNFKEKDIKKFRNYKNLVIIGMGGSILGTEAIFNFLNKKIKKKVFFFNNLNSDAILNFKDKVNFNKTLFIVISKSGETIETLSNFLSLNIIKSSRKNIIIITEKKNNSLNLLSKKYNLYFIEHKENVGGRYSVLSEAGIIPAIIMGLNISKLRYDLKKYLNVEHKRYLRESSIKISSILLNKKCNNIILINYAPELEKFLYWYQQLLAESLGKKGKGFLPVVSNCPKDHHSLLQLYLDGPKDKFYHIFSYHHDDKIILNSRKIFKLSHLHGKNIIKIKHAQKEALIKAFQKNKIPFREFKIKKITEETLGELFAYFILETIIIGKLSGLNPFDQPAVEQVKIFTKKLLK